MQQGATDVIAVDNDIRIRQEEKRMAGWKQRVPGDTLNRVREVQA
jgi:hypothetical protein